MSNIIIVNKNGIKNVGNKISVISGDIKTEMTELLEIISNIDFAWHGIDKERYVNNLNDKVVMLANISKLLDSCNDTLNYVIEKNTSINSKDNIINLYKEGRK